MAQASHCRVSLVVGHRLSNCDSQALVQEDLNKLHGMWNLPRPGMEPMTPTLAGRFLSSVPPGKSKIRLVLSEKGQKEAR